MVSLKSLSILVFFAFCAITCTAINKSPKKGLVVPFWPRHKCGDFEAFSTVSWWYNYHTYQDVQDRSPWWCTCQDGRPPKNHTICFPQDETVEFHPMVYGVSGYGNRPDFDTEPPIADWSWLVLGYNEPDQKEQSDIPPKVAAQAWKEMQDQYPDKVWVSPATAGIHTDWLDEFMAECEKLNCRVDYMSTHTYRGTPQERMSKLKDFSDRYGGRQVWLTEFAVEHEANTTKIIEFIQEFLPLLENADYIYKYSWWYTSYYENHDHTGNFWLDSNNSLLDDKSPTLTEVGKAYDHPWHLDQYKPK